MAAPSLIVNLGKFSQKYS